MTIEDAVDEPGHSVAGRSAEEPTEASPLLGRQNATKDTTNGTTPDPESSPTYNGTDNATTNDENDDDDDPAGRVGNPEMAKKMHLLLPAIGIGIYLCAVDQLLTVATYAKIGSELHALKNTSWIATAYFITLTSFQPLYGKLSDIFGRKECLLFAYSVFGLGCLGCGLAQTFPQLCAARALAGVGGGGMNAVVSILMSDIVPLRDRGLWQGYVNVIFAAGTSTGAPLGGLLADSVGWRWSFLGQVPICVAAFVSVYLVLRVPPPPGAADWKAKVAKIDFLGALLLVSAVIALLAGLDAGSNADAGWKDARAVAFLAATPVLFIAFVFVESRVASHPFAPGHIIFEPSLFAAYLSNFFGVAGQMGGIFFLPLFFQAVKGDSATVSGALLVPPMIAAVIASLGGGLIIRRTGRYRGITIGAFAVLLLAVVPSALSIKFGSTAGVVAGLVQLALGAGCGITTTLVALLSNAASEDSAVVVACSYLFRSLGSSIGISISSAVLQQVLRMQLATRLGEGVADGIEERVRESLGVIKTLPPAVAAQVRESYRDAVMAALIPTASFLLLGFTATFFIREKRLNK